MDEIRQIAANPATFIGPCELVAKRQGKVFRFPIFVNRIQFVGDSPELLTDTGQTIMLDQPPRVEIDAKYIGDDQDGWS